MEKHNLELNSACSSNYLEPHTNNSNKRAFDYEHANSAMNYKVAEEELVVSTYKSYNLQRGFSYFIFKVIFFYIDNQLDFSANEFCNSMIFLLVLHNYFNFSSTLFSKIVYNFYRLPGHEKFVVLVMSIFDQCSGQICAKF